MVTVYLPRTAAMKTENLLDFLFLQNKNIHKRLWRVFKNKEGKGKHLRKSRIEKERDRLRTKEEKRDHQDLNLLQLKRFAGNFHIVGGR